MIKIEEKRSFLKDEINKLKNNRFSGGIPFEELEEISDEDKEFYLS